jgi:tRNA(Ile)-lysidine synthetase-like protein
MWIKSQRGDTRRIETAHIEAIGRLASLGQSGRYVELPGGEFVSREFNRLNFIRKENLPPGPRISPPSEFTKLEEGVPQEFGDFRFTLKRNVALKNLDFNNEEKQELFIALLRECEELGEIRLRTRVPGDAYVPENATRAVKLKTLMIRRKIPSSKRDKHPVLEALSGNRIVWSPGLPVAREFRPAGEDARCALVVAEKLR